MSFMRIWGCQAYVRRQVTDKLGPKSDKCIFVGYPKETKGYYFYNPTEGKVFVARTGVFLEREFVSKGTSGSIIELDEVQDPQDDNEPMDELEQVPQVVVRTQPGLQVAEEQQQNSQDVEEPQTSPQAIVEQQPAQVAQAPRRSGRLRQELERYGFLIDQHGHVMLMDQDEPSTYAEAVTGPDSEKWLEAMKSEMESMYANQVWTLVDPPEGAKPIGCKWVFKRKTDMDGNVITFKGRLVAKGFKQIHGVDYDEIFSPVAMLKSIRILLAIAAYHDYEIWQMDVKTAFLNGNLLENVYMTQPEGFVNPADARKVCKLQRSIYGLKQASRSWNIRFDEVVKGFGFIKNCEEACVYKNESGSSKAFLILYVDDILLIGNDEKFLNTIKESLQKSF